MLKKLWCMIVGHAWQHARISYNIVLQCRRCGKLDETVVGYMDGAELAEALGPDDEHDLEMAADDWANRQKG